LLVVWAVTRACDLACVHCHARGGAHRDPGELTTKEGFRLIDQVRTFARRPAGADGPESGTAPVLMLTGGDPMRRPDLVTLVRYAAGTGLTVVLEPAGTAAATPTRLARLRDAGLSRLIVSLDGPDAASHDAFRRVRGSYDWTMRLIETAADLDLGLQVTTTVSRLMLPRLVAMAERVSALSVARWALTFLVRAGRGAALDQVSAHECERVLLDLYDLSLTAPFSITTTEAPHYQRVVWQQGQPRTSAGRCAGSVERGRPWRAPLRQHDGHGFVFIDHLGGIRPSGFLPMARGNVRTGSLRSVYYEDEAFRLLRNPNALVGKCGRCRFRAICGGSRSRSFAATGALMAADPLCAYEPGAEKEPLVDARP
jgi:radical SAM protein with 4Fe4S-binding SPASM domain